MFSIYTFDLLKNNLTNPLLVIKDIMLNKVIRPTEAPIADINDPIVILPLVTKK